MRGMELAPFLSFTSQHVFRCCGITDVFAIDTTPVTHSYTWQQKNKFSLSLQCPKRNISQNQTSLFIRIRVQSLRETRQRIRHASGPVITHSSHVMFQTTVNVNMLSSTSLMCFYKGWLSVCNMFQVCGFRKKKFPEKLVVHTSNTKKNQC